MDVILTTLGELLIENCGMEVRKNEKNVNARNELWKY